MASLGKIKKGEANSPHRKIDSNICDVIALLPWKPITEVNLDDVKAVYTNPRFGGEKNTRLNKLNSVARFLQFCIDRHEISLSYNVFAKFVNSQKETKTKQTTAAKKQPKYLSPTNEAKLYKTVFEDLGNELSLSIPLIIGGGFKYAELMELTWADLDIENGIVFVKSFNSTNAGYTHNFSRPLLKSWSEPIIRKRSLLLKKTSEDKLSRDKILEFSKKTSSKQQNQVLTRYIRKLVQVKSGIKKFGSGTKSTELGGETYTLLLNHYEYLLRTVCKINPESGVGQFLRGVAIKNVTEDSYREIERTYLIKRMSLDDRVLGEFDSTRLPAIHMVRSGKQLTYRIEGNVGGIAGSGIKIPKGTVIRISGSDGVHGTISATKSSHKEIRATYKIY